MRCTDMIPKVTDAHKAPTLDCRRGKNTGEHVLGRALFVLLNGGRARLLLSLSTSSIVRKPEHEAIILIVQSQADRPSAGTSLHRVCLAPGPVIPSLHGPWTT